MADRLALFTGGLFARSNAKTAHGILRYGSREVVAVVDGVSAGQVASDVVPYARRAAPIVASVAEWTSSIGVATEGTLFSSPSAVRNARSGANLSRSVTGRLSDGRSEERRVGKECTVLCRSRWSPYH